MQHKCPRSKDTKLRHGVCTRCFCVSWLINISSAQMRPRVRRKVPGLSLSAFLTEGGGAPIFCFISPLSHGYLAVISRLSHGYLTAISALSRGYPAAILRLSCGYPAAILRLSRLFPYLFRWPKANDHKNAPQLRRGAGRTRLSAPPPAPTATGRYFGFVIFHLPVSSNSSTNAAS